MTKIKMNLGTIIVFGLSLSLMISGIASFVVISVISTFPNIQIDRNKYVVVLMIAFWIVIQAYFWNYKILFNNNVIIIRNSIFDFRKSSIEIEEIRDVSIQLGLATKDKKSFYTMWLKSPRTKIQVNVKLFSEKKISCLLKDIKRINAKISLDKRCTDLMNSYENILSK